MGANTSRLLLLGLLQGEEMHGYRLHEFLAHQLQFVSDLKRPTAYRLLDQMYQEGLVARETERAGRRPERFVYRPTEAGRATFADLLRVQLASAVRAVDPGNVALLFSDHLPVEERRLLLERRLAGARVQYDELAAIVAAHPVGGSARLALEHDLVHLETELTWLTGTIASLG